MHEEWEKRWEGGYKRVRTEIRCKMVTALFTKIPHEHVPKSHVMTCDELRTRVITCVITCDHM